MSRPGRPTGACRRAQEGASSGPRATRARRSATGLLVAGGHALLALWLCHGTSRAPGTLASPRPPAVLMLTLPVSPGPAAPQAQASREPTVPAVRTAALRAAAQAQVQPAINAVAATTTSATAADVADAAVPPRCTASPTPTLPGPATSIDPTAPATTVAAATATPAALASLPPGPAEPPARSTTARADRQHCPPAAHPALLRERGIEGAVTLRVRVDPLGRAADVQLLAGSGWRLLDEAALRQARGCRFHPATQDGAPVDSWVEFPVRFALTG